MARPRKTIDPLKVIELAAKSLSVEEIAATLDVSADTLTRRFAEQLARGRGLCNGSLRRRQYEVAMGESTQGNVPMLIHLGKNRLGQKDTVEHEHFGAGGGPIVHTIRFGDGKRDS